MFWTFRIWVWGPGRGRWDSWWQGCLRLVALAASTKIRTDGCMEPKIVDERILFLHTSLTCCCKQAHVSIYKICRTVYHAMLWKYWKYDLIFCTAKQARHYFGESQENKETMKAAQSWWILGNLPLLPAPPSFDSTLHALPKMFVQVYIYYTVCIYQKWLRTNHGWSVEKPAYLGPELVLRKDHHCWSPRRQLPTSFCTASAACSLLSKIFWRFLQVCQTLRA